MLDLKSLFNLSYGMCIVSSKKQGNINGCIVNTVFQIVPEPPMLAASINSQCLTHEYIIESKVFTVSILSQNTPLSFIRRFGFRTGRDIDKFKHVNYRLGQTGSPIILAHTAAFIEAEVTDSIDIITHTLFIAEILACETLDETAEPMTYNYYRDIKHGKTPKTAATYINLQAIPRPKKGVTVMKKYKCRMCSYIYDPGVGDQDNGIDPGIAFEDLPEDWLCPDCGADKGEFEPVED